MFGWIKRLLWGVPQVAEKPPEERTEITRDELMGMMINHAFNTGECVFANIGDDGRVKIDTFKQDEKDRE